MPGHALPFKTYAVVQKKRFDMKIIAPGAISCRVLSPTRLLLIQVCLLLQPRDARCIFLLIQMTSNKRFVISSRQAGPKKEWAEAEHFNATQLP